MIAHYANGADGKLAVEVATADWSPSSERLFLRSFRTDRVPRSKSDSGFLRDGFFLVEYLSLGGKPPCGDTDVCTRYDEVRLVEQEGAQRLAATLMFALGQPLFTKSLVVVLNALRRH